MDLHQFLATIRDIETDQSKYDINKVLFDFQRQINANIFNQLSTKSDLNETFKTIWKFLFKASNNPSSNTRIAASKAIGHFLLWITPFFPESMRNSFIDLIVSTTDDTKNSAIIASSYAFISTYIAEPFLPGFIGSTQSFDQFILDDLSSSEHSASIISKFSHFGTEFLTNLLKKILTQIEEKQDRNLIRAISAILSNDPSFYIQIVLSFANSQIKKYLPLLTFLISTFQDDIRSTVDLMPIASIAIDTISDEASNLADIDSSFQILAIKSDSFSFSAISSNGMTCDMKITNKVDEKSATVNLKKVISMPSFYSLNLPLNLLMPNRENDSVPVISAKFKSIASNKNFDMNEVLSIFEPFLDGSYNEVTSSAIQAFALCINSILSIVPLKKFHSILRKVLFEKPLNWYHSSDIMKVISFIDFELFRNKMGEKCLIELFETLIGFCLCENDSLASDSMKILSEKAVVYEFDEIIGLVVKKCDFFELLKIDRCVKTLTVILTKLTFSDKENQTLLYFSQKLIEAVPMYYENVNFLCNVFEFFSIYKYGHQKSKNVLSAAYYVTFSTIEIISGQPIKSTMKIESSPFFRDLMRSDLSNRSVDIIASSIDDQKAFIFPMKRAVDFIFENAPKSGMTVVALNSYRLLPFECSTFFEQNWETLLSASEKLDVLSNLLPILKSNSDERLHSTWCRICLKIDQSSETDGYKEIIQFLISMASKYLTRFGKEDDPSVSSSYIEFYSIFEKSEVSTPIITEYVEKATDDFLREMVKKLPKLFELVPSIKSREIEPKSEKEEEKISKSQIDDQNELKKLPDKIDDSELPRLFEDAVRQSNVKILKEIVNLMLEKKMTIDLKTSDLSFPPETVPIVSVYLANYLTINDQEIDLLKPLRDSLTSWRQFSIEFFKKTNNSNKLIEKLLSVEKVKKNDVLCLCSLIGIIEFDNDLLFKLSTKLLFEAKTIGRFRITLKLLATVISIPTVKIPSTFLTSLSTNLTPIIEKVDTEGMSLSLLLVAQKVGFPQEMVKFSDDIITYSGHRSTAHGRIIQIYVGISSSFPSVSQKISDVFPDLTVSYLQSVLPSRFNLGCRLFEQCVLSIKPSGIGPFLARGIDCIVNRYQGIVKYPSSVISATRSILSFISRPSIRQQQQIVVIRNLNKVSLDLNDACFITFLSILNVVLQKFPNNNDFMKKFPDAFFDSVFSKSGYNNGNSFKYARLCLLERLKMVQSEISREKLVLNAAEQWIRAIPCYDQIQQLKNWWNIVECHFSIKKAFEVFDSVLNKFVNSCGFGAAFPTILMIFVNYNEKCSGLDEFKKLFGDVSGLANKKCQIEALEKMKKLPAKSEGCKTDDYKELIMLGLSEKD